MAYKVIVRVRYFEVKLDLTKWYSAKWDFFLNSYKHVCEMSFGILVYTMRLNTKTVSAFKNVLFIFKYESFSEN